MISIIIPTYNEAKNLKKLVPSIRQVIPNAEIIVVDDNSPDNTAKVARELGCKVVVRPKKMGLASAVIEGIKVANNDIIAVMDADLQHPPELLPKMYELARDGYDIVIASRYINGSSVKMNWFRKLISKVATKITHILLKESRIVKDPMSGYFVIKRKVINGVKLNPRGFKILLEILVRGQYSKVVEVPYTFNQREYGKSKFGIREIIEYIKLILELSEYRPIKFMIVGSSGIIVNLSVLHLMLSLGFPVFVAGATAIESAITWNFNLNDLWTFRSRRTGRKIVRWLKYHLAVGTGALINYLTLLILAFLGFPPLIADIIGIFLGYIANFLISQEVVWR